jgi:sec-independent protein translocase protein TatA
MFGIGPWELLIVFAIVLLLFGGKRLPGIATGLGSAIRNFKSAIKDPGEKPSQAALPDASSDQH